MQRLLMEVQAEKERLIRSLAAGSVENMITSSDDQTCGQVQGSKNHFAQVEPGLSGRVLGTLKRQMVQCQITLLRIH